MDINIPALISEERSLGIFLLVTVFLGGGAAWLTGRALALTWRPWWQALVYSLLLAGAVRFLHFSLFGGRFLSPYFYIVDAIVCIALAFAALRITRARMMATQYGWLYERSGPLAWRPRAGAAVSEEETSGARP